MANPKFEASTRANFTPEELVKAKANFDWGAQRMPEEHAKAVELIAAKGLGGHREVTAHYLKFKQPITPFELARIDLFKETTSAGPFGIDESVPPKTGISFVGDTKIGKNR
ncbi:hypothetical protein [Rhizobium bangladeshense]|uniref:hypothetical protein n=1 Tax=Rhizobium bangladeshense TaxID=1138189 RepID=UPI0007E588D5|nr:hypothetical protein [Rhizobium bangladeshense]